MKKSVSKKVVKKPAKKLPKAKKTTVPTHRSSSASVDAAVSKAVVQVPKSPKPTGAQVVADHQRRTAIVFSRSDDRVEYTALNVEEGLEVQLADPRDFDDRYKPLVDYPVEKAAGLYVEYARGLGATEQVMKQLAKLTTVTNEDTQMATKKKAARGAATVKTAKKTTKAAPDKAAKTTKAVKTAKPKAAAGEKKERAPRGPSAASRFQELIMEKAKGGKTCAHTDDEIFKKVQKEFGLDDSKKSYVKWYRNYLTKQGQEPPAQKE